jgi:SP family sugar porter-like MFS transporter
MVGAFGGLLFGYDWVVIGGAKPFYEAYFGIGSSPSDQGLAMTVALIGCMFGALTVGWLADRMGRKKLLTISSIVFLLSALATGAVHTFNTFLIARFFGGVGIGLASGLSLLCISPKSLRLPSVAAWYRSTR